MSRPAEDLTGRRFGQWTVIKFSGYLNPKLKNNRRWLCRCDCGTEKKVLSALLKNGRSKTCGCGPPGALVHGLALTPIYESWRGMKKRCLCPNHMAYHNYGGRGIRICRALLDSPATIVKCIGNRPDITMTLDRKDNDGHYSCGSCIHCKERGWPMNLRWATKKQQARNSRTNRVITIGGVRRLACEWAEIAEIRQGVLHLRFKNGVRGKRLLQPLLSTRRKRYTFNGISKTAPEWARTLGITAAAFRDRARSGRWGVALFAPKE